MAVSDYTGEENGEQDERLVDFDATRGQESSLMMGVLTSRIITSHSEQGIFGEGEQIRRCREQLTAAVPIHV